MSTTPPTPAIAEQAERPRFLAVDVGDWPGLEGSVRLEVDARTTVLVGKNGAGKSLVIEALCLASRLVVSLPVGDSNPWPRFFRCNIHTPASDAFGYEYEIRDAATPQETASPSEEPDVWGDLREAMPNLPPLVERAFRLVNRTELWRSADGRFSMPGKPPRRTAGPLLWFHGAKEDPEIEAEIRALKYVLKGVSLVRAGTLHREDSPLDNHMRRAVLLQRRAPEIRPGNLKWKAVGLSEVDALGERIVALWEQKRALYDEFCEVLQSLGVVREVAVDIYREERAKKIVAGRDVAAVLFDGTNLGYCSDGTLRIARIVLEMLRPQVSCLLIEEPETAVHPGLLDKLLALVEAYSADRQIVLSTHSPQVVDRFAPDQLRLVEREEGVTRVHSLSATDRDLAISYLRDQGSLSDFVFRRSDG